MQKNSIDKFPFVVVKKHRKPFTGLDDFNFSSDFQNQIKTISGEDKPLSELTKIVGAHICNGSDAIIVSDDKPGMYPNLGRQLSYLLPVFKSLCAPNFFRHKMSKTGPQILIIYPHRSACYKARNFIRQLVQSTFKVECCNNSRDFKEVCSKSQIVIMDILSLNYVLNSEQSDIVLNRLRFLIVEDYECFTGKSRQHLERTLTMANEKQLVDNHNLYQIIICSRKWNENLKAEYLRRHEKQQVPGLFVDEFSDLLMFAEIDWNLNFAETEAQRFDVTKNILKKSIANEGITIVACNDMQTANTIKGFCKSSNLLAYAVNDPKDWELIQKKVTTSAKIFICTDKVLSGADFINCTSLLSFDNPESVNRRKRLRCLWNSFPNYNSVKNTVAFKKLQVNFILTGKEDNFLKVYKFSKRLVMNTKFISPELEETGEKLEEEEEKTLQLCNFMKWFGFCHKLDKNECRLRHSFNEQDVKIRPCVAATGEIEFRVIDCTNPSEYTGLLLKQYRYEGNKRVLQKCFMSEAKQFGELLNKYYYEARHRRFPGLVEQRKIYATRFPNESGYRRVKLIGRQVAPREKLTENQSTSTTDFNDRFQVMCVDSGFTTTVTKQNLLIIPDKYAHWPVHIVKVILCNLRPPQHQPEYIADFEESKNYITHKEFRGKVWISVADCVWVRPIVKVRNHDYILGKELITRRKAMSNPTHVDTLTSNLKQLGNLSDGYYAVQSSQYYDAGQWYQAGDEEEIKWAFVNKSTVAEVHLEAIEPMFVVDPWEFYGVHKKFVKLLMTLERELNNWIKEISNNDSDFKDFRDQLSSGLIVACKREENEIWMRGEILNKIEDEDDNDCEYYDVFFVDYGGNFPLKPSQILPIKREFVARLPFQAIRFSLGHIKPKTEDDEYWSNDAVEHFRDLLLPDRESVTLNVAVLQDYPKDKEDEMPYRYYEAVAFIDQDEVGKTLLQKEMVVSCGDISEFLNTAQKSLAELQNSLAENDDDEDWEAIEDEKTNLTNNLSNEPDPPLNDDDFDCYDVRRFFTSQTGQKEIPTEVNDLSIIEEFKTPPETPERSVSPQPKVSKKKKRKPMRRHETIMYKSEINDKLFHPTVYWHQTPNEVVLQVQLPDVKEYKLELTNANRGILFQTETPANYGFEIALFGKVLTDPVIDVFGQYVKIVLHKRLKNKIWVRILESRDDKQIWLKENPDYINDDESDEEGVASWMDCKTSRRIDDADSSDSSDDEELMFSLPPPKEGFANDDWCPQEL